MAAKPLVCLIVCAAPPAHDVEFAAAAIRAQGWEITFVPTPRAVPFLDLPRLAEFTPYPIRSEYRHPGEDALPDPTAVLAAPATYNTVNKWAAGIADTLALGILAEAIGAQQIPVVVAPWGKPALTRHPAFYRSLNLLRTCGAHVVTNLRDDLLAPEQRVPAFPWRAGISTLHSAGQRRQDQ